MVPHSNKVDLVFSALSDKNRRRVVELLHISDASIQDLSQSFTISFQGLSKHIKILELAGIVNKRKQGKYIICSLNHSALKDSLKWISFYSNFWNESFNKLDSRIKQQKNEE